MAVLATNGNAVHSFSRRTIAGSLLHARPKIRQFDIHLILPCLILISLVWSLESRVNQQRLESRHILTRVLVFQAVQVGVCIIRLALVCPRKVKAFVSSLAGYQPPVAGLPSGARKLVHSLAFHLLGAMAESLMAWRPAGFS